MKLQMNLDWRLALGLGLVMGAGVGWFAIAHPLPMWTLLLVLSSLLIGAGSVGQTRMGWIVDKSSLPQGEQGDKAHKGEHRHV